MTMMMLGSRNVSLKGFSGSTESYVLRVRDGTTSSAILEASDAVLAKPGTPIAAGQTTIALERDAAALRGSAADRAIILPNDFEYLRDGDIVAVATSYGRKLVTV